jgi:hypothetical protein
VESGCGCKRNRREGKDKRKGEQKGETMHKETHIRLKIEVLEVERVLPDVVGQGKKSMSNDGRSSIYLLMVTSHRTFPQFNNALERRARLNARIGDSLRRFEVGGGLYCTQFER